MGTPSVCLSPGSLEIGFTQHVPRGPLQGRTPVRSHWAASLGSPQCFSVTPQQGGGARQADPLCPGRWPTGMSGTGRGVWDLLQPSSARFPMLHTGLGRPARTTPRLSKED